MITKIKESFLKTLKDKRLYIFLGVTLIFFGILVIEQYATDSYAYFTINTRQLFNHILSLGRIVTAFFWLIFSFTNYSTTYITSYLIAIVFTTLSMYKLNEILKREIKDEKVTIFISILTVINICILELYMYLEKGILILSIYFTILAIGNLDEALKGNKKAWIKIFIEMLIANCSYQGTVGLFVALGTIYIIKNSKKIGEFIKNNIIVAILYGLPALCNFLFIKLVVNGSRLGNEITVWEKLAIIIKDLKNIILNSFYILPKFTYLGFVVLIFIIFVIKLIMEKSKEKNIPSIFLNIFFFCYIVCATLFASAMPQVLQNYVYIVPRNMYAFGAMPAILILFMYKRVNIGKVLNKLIPILGVIFLIVEFYNFSEIIIDNYYTNMKDREIAEKIASVSKKYEEETGNTITKIIIYQQGSIAPAYENVRWNGDVNVRLFYTEWGIQGILSGLMRKRA